MGLAGLGLHSRAVGVQAWRGFTVLQVYFWLRTCVVHVNAVGVIIISNNDIIMLSCELSHSCAITTCRMEAVSGHIILLQSHSLTLVISLGLELQVYTCLLRP